MIAAMEKFLLLHQQYWILPFKMPANDSGGLHSCCMLSSHHRQAPLLHIYDFKRFCIVLKVRARLLLDGRYNWLPPHSMVSVASLKPHGCAKVSYC